METVISRFPSLLVWVFICALCLNPTLFAKKSLHKNQARRYLLAQLLVVTSSRVSRASSFGWCTNTRQILIFCRPFGVSQFHSSFIVWWMAMVQNTFVKLWDLDTFQFTGLWASWNSYSLSSFESCQSCSQVVTVKA